MIYKHPSGNMLWALIANVFRCIANVLVGVSCVSGLIVLQAVILLVGSCLCGKLGSSSGQLLGTRILFNKDSALERVGTEL